MLVLTACISSPKVEAADPWLMSRTRLSCLKHEWQNHDLKLWFYPKPSEQARQPCFELSPKRRQGQCQGMLQERQTKTDECNISKIVVANNIEDIDFDCSKLTTSANWISSKSSWFLESHVCALFALSLLNWNCRRLSPSACLWMDQRVLPQSSLYFCAFSFHATH